MRFLASTSLSLLAMVATTAPVAAGAQQRLAAAHDSLAAGAAAPAVAADTTTQLPRDVRPARYRILINPDPANLRFTARTEVDVEVLQPTRSITLNAADLEFRNVSLGNDSGLALNPRSTDLDSDKQTATFGFARTLAPGRYRLTIDYSGKINEQANGLFALDYPGSNGTQERALFTQFEAPDARRMFPSWDEPQFRTPYELSVVAPRGQMAVSNMPEARREARPDGSSLVTFQPTPAMSSYLLFLALGDFDRITDRVGDTEVGVVTRRGAGELGRWALASQVLILPYYNDYFGVPYPLPKLDNIAGPGSSAFFGAMENWGAIFSFESILLDDPAITSQSTRQSIFEVDAHEMAHQWFGDLVTMAWWDDLWLNEGFASWMATKSTAALHPEWEPLLGRVGARESAMDLDAVRTTHPVVRHVETVEQISQAFDSITYSKGEAVIAMLEDYVGEEAWRSGVRAYMARHRLGNTTSADLWRSVDSASGQPVSQIARDYTEQPGVPLVRIEQARCVGGRTQLTLRQGEFSRDDPDKRPLSWRVPVIASAGGAPQRVLIEGGTAQAQLPGCGTLIVNHGQTGYYRTLYAPEQLQAIARGFAELRPIDQIGLVADNWVLALGGYQSPALALDLVDAVPANANPQLVSRAAGVLADIHHMQEANPDEQRRVAAYAARKLGPVLAQLGWTARPDEAPTMTVLRSQLIAILGNMGDPAVVAEVNRRFAVGDPSISTGPLRQTLLAILATNADAAAWERLHQQAREESNPLVKQSLYSLLGAARDEALARRALDLALSGEAGTGSSRLIQTVAAQHPDLVVDFALANRDRVEALVDVSSRSRFLPGIAAGSADRATIAKIQSYADRYLTAQSRQPADHAAAEIETRVRTRELRLPEIARWFAAHPA